MSLLVVDRFDLDLAVEWKFSVESNAIVMTMTEIGAIQSERYGMGQKFNKSKIKRYTFDGCL